MGLNIKTFKINPDNHSLEAVNQTGENALRYLKECEKVDYTACYEVDGFAIETNSSYFNDAIEINTLVSISKGDQSELPFICKADSPSENEKYKALRKEILSRHTYADKLHAHFEHASLVCSIALGDIKRNLFPQRKNDGLSNGKR